MKQVQVIKNSYFDSATLMAAAQGVKRTHGLSEAVAVMATDANKGLLRDVGLLDASVQDASSRDLVLAVSGGADVESALADLAQQIQQTSAPAGGSSAAAERITSLEQAFETEPDSNVVLISVPGRFAAEEAHAALDAGRHVMIFSDNVSLEDEIALKKKARDKGLLMMGPDCGTAIIGGAPLAFANVIRRGTIGIVAAAGTGLQEVSCLIDHYGGGITQGIGTGGRDVKDAVGGLQMLQSAHALIEDPATEVLVIVSKPPQPETFTRILEFVQRASKPVVVCMLGGSRDAVEAAGGIFASTLEEGARKAVETAGIRVSAPSLTVSTALRDEIGGLDPGRKYFRALYTGGTLCYEALILLGDDIELNSNISLQTERRLEDSFRSVGHTAVDMGEDEFTDGRPHPMIEPSLRAERLEQELQDPEVAAVMLDFVLGYGSHEDPVGAMANTIRTYRGSHPTGGPVLIASVTGTQADPQQFPAQMEKLADLGVHAYRSNAEALAAVRTVLKEQSK